MRVIFRCEPALIDRLARPVPARASLPDWLRTMPAKAVSETHGGEVRTAKQCPPFIDAMSHGFTIPLPCDLQVSGGRLSWDWDLPPLTVDEHPRSPLSFFVPAQVTGTPLHRDSVIVKFNCFWTIALEEGWSLFATHPANRDDLPFRTLSGLVDSDRFVDIGILFPAVWTDRLFEGTLPRGTPIAQCFPVPRDPLELAFASFEANHQVAYGKTARAVLSEPGVYRRSFRAKRPRSAGEFPVKSGEIKP